MSRIGIDLGGSHISVGLVENGNVLGKKIFIYENKENSSSLMRVFVHIETYIKELKKSNSIESIGLSLPGNCRNGILLDAKNIKNINMAGCNIVEKVQKKLDIPTYIDNDALCALLGERRYGVLKDYKNAIMLTFGTDIGYSMCFEKNGEEYFLDMESRDFLNDYSNSFPNGLMGIRGLKNMYIEQINDVEISRKKIFEDAKANKDKAVKLLEKYIENTCIGIERLHELTKIDTFCIGGGLSEHGELFINSMRDKLQHLNIFIAKNMNDAGLIGATEIQSVHNKANIFPIQ